MEVKELSLILGKTFSKITQNGQEAIFFETKDGEKFEMSHQRDCCEKVSIEDIVGDLQSLVGNPILVAEERTQGGKIKIYGDSDGVSLWTFYELATIKGAITIRWFGSSHANYSMAVDLIKIS